MSNGKKLLVVLSAAAVLAGMAVAVPSVAPPARAADPAAIQINGAEQGLPLAGIGGMSVAGSSKLLFDYPAQQQTQVLDYLYCSPMAHAAPGYCTHGVYGAALQRLKAEIGADSNADVGAEPSIERQRGVVDCNVGWEFRLMSEARKRNPNVQIDALAWSWPGWITPSGSNYNDRVFSQDTINYLLDYLGCAKSNGTPVNTLGLWNERIDPNSVQVQQWTVELRHALDAKGYSRVQLMADDGTGWGAARLCSAPQTEDATAFCNAVSILSDHYPQLAWFHQDNIYASPDAYKRTWSPSATPAASTSFGFSGTSIKWVAATCYSSGMADVYLDGQLAAHDVDEYSPADAPGATPVGCVYQKVLFSRSGLADGRHTIKIVVSADHNPAAQAPWWVYSDAFAVDGPPDGTTSTGPCSVQKCVDDQDLSIQYGAPPGPLAGSKPLMASEDDAPSLYDRGYGADWYHNPLMKSDWAGARFLGEELNQNYVGFQVTGDNVYTLLSGYYDQAQYAKGGLMAADTPWAAGGGPWYDVQSAIWVAAHTTQFTQPGTWRYVGNPSSPSDTASCYLGSSSCADPSGATGSYVTLRATHGSDYAIVADTSYATGAQAEQFCLSGGLSTGRVHVWETNATKAFANVANLATSGGCFSYTLDPDAVYTFTSENTGHAGTVTQSFTEQAMSLPYSDNFQRYGPRQQVARYFIDQQGAFETGHACPAGGRQWCLQQVIKTPPIEWEGRSEPYTVVGDLGWKDYQVQAHLTIPTPRQSASVIGRLQRSQNDFDFSERARYQAQVTNEGNGTWTWTLYRVDPGGNYVTLTSGRYANGSAWIDLALRMTGSQISMLLDGTTVGQATDATYPAGMAGLTTGAQGTTYDVADFDSFCVRSPDGHC